MNTKTTAAAAHEFRLMQAEALFRALAELYPDFEEPLLAGCQREVPPEMVEAARVWVRDDTDRAQAVLDGLNLQAAPVSVH